MNQSDAQKPSGDSQSEPCSSGNPASSESGNTETGPAPGSSTADMEQGATGGSIAEDQVQMFAVVPLTWCPHLEEDVAPLPARGFHVKDPCMECGHVGENWVCLRCHEVHCGRFVNEHMLMHGLELEHRIVLSYADLSAWCYACDAYVHHKSVLDAKTAAHVSKFGYPPDDS